MSRVTSYMDKVVTSQVVWSRHRHLRDLGAQDRRPGRDHAREAGSPLPSVLCTHTYFPTHLTYLLSHALAPIVPCTYIYRSMHLPSPPPAPSSSLAFLLFPCPTSSPTSLPHLCTAMPRTDVGYAATRSGSKSSRTYAEVRYGPPRMLRDPRY
eukprot:2343770-Rhodomonas_salina.4